jgi:glutamate racemase
MPANRYQPVGVFDSGIGGLTVANAISKLLPNEQIIYFGDTAHMPYGDKSKELVSSYADKITDFLL